VKLSSFEVFGFISFWRSVSLAVKNMAVPVRCSPEMFPQFAYMDHYCPLACKADAAPPVHAMSTLLSLAAEARCAGGVHTV
jgi:hypothetical protein